MSNRRRFVMVMLLILVAACIVQMMRSGWLATWVRLDRVGIESETALQNAPVLDTYQEILVLTSDEDLGSSLLRDNVIQTLRMERIPFTEVSASSMEQKGLISKLEEEDLLVVATESKVDAEAVRSFVENGGHVAILVRAVDSGMDSLVGILENRRFLEEDVRGITFESPLFPGLDDLTLEGGKIVHSVLDVTLDETVEVMARAEGVPILWRRQIGSGRILYVNSTFLMDKANRGMLAACLAAAQEYHLSTVLGAKVVDIDDFPAPIQVGRDEMIDSQYHMGNRSFYRQIWWSSMANLAERFDLVYTGMMIGTYTQTTSQPLLALNDDELSDIAYFGRKLIESGGELGVHGYNHNSLALEGEMYFAPYGYQPWESIGTMREGLQLLSGGVESLFGDYPIRTYVAPSNLLSDTGKKILPEVFSELGTIAGIYTGESAESLLIQEFGPDPMLEGVYDFPRFSSGYLPTDEMMWDIYNGIAHYGLVHHFIHPDDLLDEDRSEGKTWQELESSLTTLFSEIYSFFPHLVPMTDSQAALRSSQHQALTVQIHQESATILKIHLQNAVMPVHHFLYLEESLIEAIDGGAFYLLDEALGLYLLVAESPEMTVRLKVRP